LGTVLIRSGNRYRRLATVRKERSPGIVLLGRDPGAELWRDINGGKPESPTRRHLVERLTGWEGFTLVSEGTPTGPPWWPPVAQPAGGARRRV